MGDRVPEHRSPARVLLLAAVCVCVGCQKPSAAPAAAPPVAPKAPAARATAPECASLAAFVERGDFRAALRVDHRVREFPER